MSMEFRTLLKVEDWMEIRVGDGQTEENETLQFLRDEPADFPVDRQDHPTEWCSGAFCRELN